MDRQMTTIETSVASLRMNQAACEIADGMTDQADILRIHSFPLPSGARVIDAGVEVEGGIEAGLAISEICMGGLGNVTTTPVQIGSQSYPGLIVWTDHPAVACMASQYAGWSISVGKFFAMGSGPLRAHARVERELFEKLGYEERAEEGVLVLETRALPTDEVAAWVAEKAHLPASQLRFVVVPTASLAGGVQISARIIETGLHKMETLGFDVRRVVSALGTAPLAPIAKNDLRAIGRTNHCIL
jgi:methenyltetrahydromethanopterin cyclohydrolase